MKHIGWCLERIEIAIGDMPAEVISEADKDKANRILDEVQKYVDTLAKIVQNPRFNEIIHRLEKIPTESIGLQARVMRIAQNQRVNSLIHEGIGLQANEIEELIEDFERLLLMLDLYIKSLRDIIKNHPEKWRPKLQDLVQTIHEKFGGERAELRKEFQFALHLEEELRKLEVSEEHLVEFFK